MNRMIQITMFAVSTSRVINALNQVWKEVGAADLPAVTTNIYDPQGNLAEVRGPLGRRTASTFDELNRVSTVTNRLSASTPALNPVTQLWLRRASTTSPR